MVIRQFGKILRGKATPVQVFMAGLLGGVAGFVPGVAQAPGLIAALFVLVAVLNANLVIFALLALATKLLALAIMPLTFEVGHVLLDGPTRPLFAWAINAPVLALFGFDYYVTTGGLALGLIVGTLAGLLAASALTRFRRRMAALEEGSEAYRRYTSAFWARLLAFLFVGGGLGKRSYKDILARRVGNPIRVFGVVLVVLVVAAAALVQMFASEPIVTWAVQKGFERANGATADVARADLDLKAGKFEAEGIALADPNVLDTDVLRVGRLTADVSGADLLRKRLRLDNVVLMEASHGEKRARPGVLVGPAPESGPPPSDDPAWGDKTLEDYVKEAQVWKDRLAQARGWLEKIDRRLPGRDEEGGAATAPDEAPGETLRERLEREIGQKGYTRVTATHLVEAAPTLVITSLTAERVEAVQMQGESINVYGENLSTQPWLLEEEPRITIRTDSSDRLSLALALPGVSKSGQGVNRAQFAYRGLPADAIAARLTVPGLDASALPLQGGTIDVAFDGTWSNGGLVDFPLRATIRDSRIAVPGAGATNVSELTLPIAVRGPLDDPRVTLEADALADALVAAGKAELANKVRGEADKALGSAKDEIGKELGDKIGEEADGLIGNLLGDDKKKDDR